MPTKKYTKKYNPKEKPQAVIFGRTNTGKSTFFNTLSESKEAMVSPKEGVTRDSNVANIYWQGVEFELVDTGGFIDYLDTEEPNKKKRENTIDEKVQKQALKYLKKGDVIIFLLDSKVGILPQDEQIANFLKKRYSNQKNKIITVANKVDKGIREQLEVAIFHKLNLGEPMPISAITGSGTGDLLDRVVEIIEQQDKKTIPKKEKKEPDKSIVSVCLTGKPNVGKSTLLNSLLDYEKVIVSDIPHTTREPQNVEITYNDQRLIFVDTAGINKKARKPKDLEKYGIERSLQALGKADISLLILDITQEITQQERKLIDEIIKKRKSFIIIASKWDLIDDKNTSKFIDYIYGKLPFATWAPIKFVSAYTGKNVDKIYELILEIKEQRQAELSKSQLDKFLNKIIKKHSPTKAKGYKRPYIYEINQPKINPPKFDIRIGKKDTLNESYVRFIKNQLRETFGFKGTPINIEVVR